MGSQETPKKITDNLARSAFKEKNIVAVSFWQT